MSKPTIPRSEGHFPKEILCAEQEQEATSSQMHTFHKAIAHQTVALLQSAVAGAHLPPLQQPNHDVTHSAAAQIKHPNLSE